MSVPNPVPHLIPPEAEAAWLSTVSTPIAALCPPPPRALDPAVRAKIIKKHKAGLSLAAIARQLTEDQVPTATGGKWYPSTIRAVVTG